MKHILWISLPIIIITSIVCCTSPNKQIEKKLNQRYKRKVKLMNTNFLNKDLSIIYSIGDEELIFENNKLFVLFSGPNTCSSCIYNAFEAINEVEFLKGNDFIYTLSWENKFNRELILIDSTYLTLELFTNSYSPTLFILDF